LLIKTNRILLKYLKISYLINNLHKIKANSDENDKLKAFKINIVK